jgi:hypothetical protein
MPLQTYHDIKTTGSRGCARQFTRELGVGQADYSRQESTTTNKLMAARLMVQQGTAQGSLPLSPPAPGCPYGAALPDVPSKPSD